MALTSPRKQAWTCCIQLWVIQVTHSLTAICIVAALHSGLLRLLWMEELVSLPLISLYDQCSQEPLLSDSLSLPKLMIDRRFLLGHVIVFCNQTSLMVLDDVITFDQLSTEKRKKRSFWPIQALIYYKNTPVDADSGCAFMVTMNGWRVQSAWDQCLGSPGVLKPRAPTKECWVIEQKIRKCSTSVATQCNIIQPLTVLANKTLVSTTSR